MKAIKLTQKQFQRSLNAKVDHVWVYNKNINDKKIHRNGISLNMYNGKPQFCIILDDEKNIQDQELEQIFGKGFFINGGVSPDDKEQMIYDSYYIKFN
tara:strand:+ start:93 stop:386 length:294 start_codon:yes stop_codon:yes gene_type:complete